MGWGAVLVRSELYLGGASEAQQVLATLGAPEPALPLAPLPTRRAGCLGGRGCACPWAGLSGDQPLGSDTGHLGLDGTGPARCGPARVDTRASLPLPALGPGAWRRCACR